MTVFVQFDVLVQIEVNVGQFAVGDQVSLATIQRKRSGSRSSRATKKYPAIAHSCPDWMTANVFSTNART